MNQPLASALPSSRGDAKVKMRFTRILPPSNGLLIDVLSDIGGGVSEEDVV